MVTQNTLRMCKEKGSFFELSFKLATTVDLKNCLKHIIIPLALQKCASISWLTSNISTMLRPMLVRLIYTDRQKM